MTAARQHVCIIGLGYVGITLAIAMANAGFAIDGVERSPLVLEALRGGLANVHEDGLAESLARHLAEGRIRLHESVPRGRSNDVYIVTVGTPVREDSRVDLDSVGKAMADVAVVLKDGDLVILRSTIKIGTSRALAERILDPRGVDYDVAFCPERTVEGKAIAELRTLPQIVGGRDERAAAAARAVFAVLTPKVVVVESLEVAEMAKLVSNTYRDVTFSFANEIALMCDAIGISAADVIHAACEDYPRARIPSPGLVGGPCLTKDSLILAEGMGEHGVYPSVTMASRSLNQSIPASSLLSIRRLLEDLGQSSLDGHKISILGLAFKGAPETIDLRGTMAFEVVGSLKGAWSGAQYVGYDPVVPHEEFGRFGLEPVSSLEQAFEGASLVVIQNNHRAFVRMPLASLMAEMRSPGLVYDFWGLFSRASVTWPQGRRYAAFGSSGLPAREPSGAGRFGGTGHAELRAG
ncbi:MAG: nucleotide sugar dehydrogenase [Rhizobiales bacterium]|nr:nucleotide sugar dehydrogenase [Hyphomicrobiales bacterium]